MQFEVWGCSREDEKHCDNDVVVWDEKGDFELWVEELWLLIHEVNEERLLQLE